MKILYFIAEYAPTPEEELDVLTLGFPVCQRNALLAAQDAPEACDGVLGAVPENYAHFPNGKDVVEAHRLALLEQVAARAKASPVQAKPEQPPAQTKPETTKPPGGVVVPGWASAPSVPKS